MDRRTFLAGALAAGAAAVTAGKPYLAHAAQPKHKFKLKYAPHFGMFRNSAGKDPLDELKFAAAVGFTAWEDNDMMAKPAQLQEDIAQTMEKLGIEMGVLASFSGFPNTDFVTKTSKDYRDFLRKEMQ